MALRGGGMISVGPTEGGKPPSAIPPLRFFEETMRPFSCFACKETHRAPTNLGGEEYCTECAIALIDKLGDNHPTVILAFAKWDIEIENALNEAWEEGRLHPDIAAARGVETGEHECPVCGMRHWTDLDSQQCCLPGLRALERMDEAQRLSGPTDLPVVVNAPLLRAALAGKAGYDISCLADVKDESLYEEITARFGAEHPELCERLDYIYYAQRRFYEMLDAWRAGDIETVGRIFRRDGIGLRDDYKISGPELETMCDIVRTVPGVLGERMLGGGDKGASGALVKADSVEAVKAAVEHAYPRSRPAFADKYAVHVCKVVDGVRVFEDIL